MVTLTVKVEGIGEVEVVGYGKTTNSNSFTIPTGASVTFRATPGQGYTFVKWTDVWATGRYETAQNPWTDAMMGGRSQTIRLLPTTQPLEMFPYYRLLRC